MVDPKRKGGKNIQINLMIKSMNISEKRKGGGGCLTRDTKFRSNEARDKLGKKKNPGEKRVWSGLVIGISF